MWTADTDAASRYPCLPMVGDILQPTHLLFILVVALLVLGPKRLPEVGRTLGSGLRDFRQAINGESTHDDRAPQAYVEPQTDPVAADDGDISETEPASFDVPAEAPDVVHEPQLEEPAAGDDLPAAETADDVLAAETTDDLHAPAATDDSTEPAAVPTPVAAGSSSGFASALASSRQQSGGEPASDDE
jgi:sec-independent protein translocase protein TatA